MIDTEREATIRTEAEALAEATITGNRHAGIHLARLLLLDENEGALFWYAQHLAKILHEAGDVGDVKAAGLYCMMIQAAKALGGAARRIAERDERPDLAANLESMAMQWE